MMQWKCMDAALRSKSGRHREWRMTALVFLLVNFTFIASAFGQFAGTQSNFIIGVGARGMGLGGGYVAMPFDATAVYWNPAGLDQIERNNFVLFHTPLLEGARFNYVGYAQPTVQFGTIGFGILHLSAGDGLEETDIGGHRGESFDYSQTQFVVAYAKQLPLSFTLGASIKLERQQLADGAASGAGLDLGLIYDVASDIAMFRDIKLGVAVQNVVTPRFKLRDEAESIPRVARFGVAKPVYLGGDGNHLNILFGYQINVGADPRLTFGSEYVFGDLAMLRAGYDGVAPSFGGGLAFRNYRIDYALSRLNEAADVAALQHRLSLTVEFGKTKTERIELARALELRRIEEETTRRVSLQRQIDYNEMIDKGKAYYQQGDYFIALIRFSTAREIFPESNEAATWLENSRKKLDEQREREMQRIAAQSQQEGEAAAKQSFVELQFRRGMQNLEAGRYGEAVAEWERGLEQDPENELLKRWIAKTRDEMRAHTAELVRRARGAESENRLTDALELYDQALKQGMTDQTQRQALESRVAELRKQLTFNDLFRTGLTAYIEKDYKTALENFEAALKIVPNDERLQQYLSDAEARVNATVMDFADDDMRRRFLEAVRLIQRESYDDALRILGELQQQQRYNKRILDAIDLARERKQKR